MIPASWAIENQTAYRARFVGIYLVLAAIAIVFVGLGVVKLAGNVRVETKTVHVKTDVGTTSKLEQALGTPTSVPCGQVLAAELASQLQGAKCDAYQRQADIVVVVHG